MDVTAQSDDSGQQIATQLLDSTNFSVVSYDFWANDAELTDQQ
jgi:hypothetical protein